MEEPNNKEVCPHCKQVHDMELDSLTEFATTMASSFTEHAFPEIWKDVKRDSKELNKRELAQNMFYTGATQMLVAFVSIMHQEEKKK